MSSSKSAADLAALAREYASQSVDLYAILGFEASSQAAATATPGDLHKAWRRLALKAHPDKAGAAFDAEAYERLGRARDILSDPAARAVYDNAIRAATERARARQAMDAERRRFAEELEAAERRARGEAPKGSMSAAEMTKKMQEEEAARKDREWARQHMEARRKEREAAAAASAGVEGGEDGAKPQDIKDDEKKPSATVQQKQEEGPGPAVSGATEEDMYDAQIADLERRLAEVEQRRSEKRARKAARQAAREEKNSAATSAAATAASATDVSTGASKDGDDVQRSQVEGRRSRSPPHGNAGRHGSRHELRDLDDRWRTEYRTFRDRFEAETDLRTRSDIAAAALRAKQASVRERKRVVAMAAGT